MMQTVMMKKNKPSSPRYLINKGEIKGPIMAPILQVSNRPWVPATISSSFRDSQAWVILMGYKVKVRPPKRIIKKKNNHPSS